MSGSMRRIGEYLGLLEDAEHYDEEFDRADALATGAVEPVRAERRPAPVADLAQRRRPTAGPATSAAADLARIAAVQPGSYNDARTVGESFREGVPVIMNLSDMEDPDAKRVVDFAAGLVFATHGSIERVANKVFLLSPAGVSVSTEHKEQIAGVGFYNQS